MEDKKDYGIIGTVTIGSDEYKDLIVDAVSAKAEKDYYMHQYWDSRDKWNECEKKVSALKAELDTLKEELAKYKRYIKENDAQDDFELWILKVNRGD